MVFNKKVGIFVSLTVGLVALGVAFESASAVITVQIGGATRLTSPSRSRYHCYWDCDLVGCQLTRDDDECAYDCEKICRPRYDYLGRSGAGESTVNEKSAGGQASSTTGGNEPETELKPKTGADDSVNPTLLENEINLAGQTVRLHLPRNVSARNFGIWERCAKDEGTGKLVEHSFSL